MTPVHRMALAMLATAVVAAPSSAQQVRTLPAADASYDEPFTMLIPGSLRELRDGRVIVADPRDKLLQLLDLSSSQATPIGREGRGPAEWALPFRVLPAPGDSTLLFDVDNTRYLAIGPDGKPGTTFRMESATPTPAPGAAGGPGGPGGPRIAGLTLVTPRTSDAQGRIYYEGPSFAQGPNGMVPSDSADLVRYDRATGRHEVLARIKLARANVQTSGGGGNNVRFSVSGANPLTPRDEWAVFPDGRVAIVRATDYHVDWVMPNGSQSSSAPIRFTPVRMTAADIREEEALRERAQGNAMRVSMTNDNGSISRSTGFGRPPGAPPLEPLTDWPEVKPPFRAGQASVWARPNGELWVRRMEPAGAKGTLFDVIDARGAVTHQVRVPEGLTVVGMGNGTIYTTKADEDDLLMLQRHRMP